MASAATESALDVARWFVDRARLDDNYLQAQKLQRLLYLAQGLYAGAYHGRQLMPAIFVAHEMGPVEPNVFRAFELGRPAIAEVSPSAEVVTFLELIWRKYGNLSTERLNDMVRRHDIFLGARAQGENEEITVEAMAAFFIRKEDPKPTVRTSDGRVVQKWIPPTRAVRNRPA